MTDFADRRYRLQGNPEQRMVLAAALDAYAKVATGEFAVMLMAWKGREDDLASLSKAAGALCFASNLLFGIGSPTVPDPRISQAAVLARTLGAEFIPSDTPLDVEMDSTEAAIAREALDLYSRIDLGQTLSMGQFCRWNGFGRDCDLDTLEGALAMAHKIITGYDRGASRGIHNKEVPERARVAYDLQQVVRHRLAWDRDPDGGPAKGVAFDTPRAIAIGGELAKFETLPEPVLEPVPAPVP